MYQGKKACEITGWKGIDRGKRNIRVLVVDDDDGLREMLSKVLCFMGYEAVQAHSGSEALNIFLEGPFSLVMTDLQMPGMDGWSLASRIKERSPEIPILLMTAHARHHIMKELKGSSIDSALFKPFSLEELRREVNKALEGRSQ